MEAVKGHHLITMTSGSHRANIDKYLVDAYGQPIYLVDVDGRIYNWKHIVVMTPTKER